MGLAKTNKIARFVKQPQELSGPANGKSNGKPNGLYLVELRSRHAVAQSTLPRRKLVVSVEPGKSADAPRPIKIIYHT